MLAAVVPLYIRDTLASIRSEEEIRANNVAAMGPELGALYSALWQELAALYFKWHEYVVLYGTKESRVELLNASAPFFFHLVEDAFWENTLLHLCRLTDPPLTTSHKNLTIARLPGLADATISDRVKALATEAEDKTKFCRDWRNRRISHADLDLNLNETARPLEKASRQAVEVALKALGNVLNEFEMFYLKSSTGFDLVVVTDGAEELLYVLDDGVTARKRQEERRQSRKSLPEVE